MPDITQPVTVRVDKHASALVRASAHMLESNGLDEAFWVVCDDDIATKSLSLLGHGEGRLPKKGWKQRDVSIRGRGPSKKTYDSECIARDGSTVYLLGSHLGPKAGPLDPKRAFLARFNELSLKKKVSKARVDMEIVQRPFALHRVINDALVEAQIELIPLGPSGRRAYIERTLKRAAKKDRAWGADVRVDDWPVAIECVSFVDDGVFIGLRYPCTREGHPIAVKLDSLEGLFGAQPTPPRAQEIWVMDELGNREQPAGLVAMEREGETLHVVCGPIASRGRTRGLLDDYPSGRQTRCEHWVLGDGEARALRRFRRRESVGGLTLVGENRVAYLIEEQNKKRVQIESMA